MTPETGPKDCIFCKIVRGEIPSDIVYQDESVLVFPDINPATPVHLLIIPREHIVSLADMDESQIGIVGKMVAAANLVARQKGIAESGYRLCINSGPDAGQVVWHLHMHLMGGRELGWSH